MSIHDKDSEFILQDCVDVVKLLSIMKDCIIEGIELLNLCVIGNEVFESSIRVLVNHSFEGLDVEV